MGAQPDGRLSRLAERAGIGVVGNRRTVTPASPVLGDGRRVLRLVLTPDTKVAGRQEAVRWR